MRRLYQMGVFGCDSLMMLRNVTEDDFFLLAGKIITHAW